MKKQTTMSKNKFCQVFFIFNVCRLLIKVGSLGINIIMRLKQKPMIDM